MTQGPLRTAVVGASTLLGREVAEQLADADTKWNLTLLDDEEAAGQMTAAGEEALVIQPLTPGSLSGQDVVFFTCDVQTAKTHWPEVKRSGAVVVDLSGGLAGEAGVVTFSPWLAEEPLITAGKLDLSTTGVAAPHPAALFLALIAQRLQTLGTVKLIATVLQPASQYGKPALDELHAQTAALLTFQSLPHEIFDAQSAYNLLPALGPEAGHTLADDSDRIRRDFATLLPGPTLELQLIQAPVFHSFAASIYAELQPTAVPSAPSILDERTLTKALHSEWIQVAGEGDQRPSNQAATELDRVLVALKSSDARGSGTPGFWIWMSADNLRLTARHAVACAAELVRLRPAGSVQ